MIQLLHLITANIESTVDDLDRDLDDLDHLSR